MDGNTNAGGIGSQDQGEGRSSRGRAPKTEPVGVQKQNLFTGDGKTMYRCKVLCFHERLWRPGTVVTLPDGHTLPADHFEKV